MKKYKSYDDIMEEKKNPVSSDIKLLGEGNTEKGLVSVNENTALIAAELDKGLTPAVLQKISDMIPHAATSVILANAAISPDKKQALAKISDELTTDLYTVQRRRSDYEKRMSVLQDNRHTTPAAKFHQAKLESTVQWGNCVNNALNIEKVKIKIEKLKYKYDKLKEKIVLESEAGEDTFFMEKKLQLLAIKITEELISLKSIEIEAESLASELLEWSTLKEELFEEANRSGEYWNPEDVNDGQEIFLSRRFFQNYIMAHKSSPDSVSTSDILNIDGLASGVIKDSLKKQNLGIVLQPFADEQIKFLVAGLMGIDCDIIRQGNLPVALFNKQTKQLLIIDKRVVVENAPPAALPMPDVHVAASPETIDEVLQTNQEELLKMK